MKKYILFITMFFVLYSSGCTKWLDINQNPNNASSKNITMDLMLPAVEYMTLNNHCNSSYSMLLSSFLTKSGEYSGNYTFLNGNIMPQNLDNWWETYYSIIRNLQIICDKADENGDLGFKGVAKTLQVINYQRMVDIWGNIPYSQACDAEKINQPEYDEGSTIYVDLLKQIDKAIADFDEIIGKYDPTLLKKADFYTNGDVNKWRRIAYSVKLRLLMRISNVQDVKEDVASIADKCLDIDENVDANPGYYVETGKMNIFYESYGWDKNYGQQVNLRQYVPTSALVDMLRLNKDPRLRVYVDPREQLGNAKDDFSNYKKFGLDKEPYVGVPFGQVSPSRMAYTTTIGTGILAGSSDKDNGRLRASTFMTGAEVGFLLAEAALRGMIPGGDTQAKEYYEKSVIAAMKRHEKAMQDPSENFDEKISKNMKPAIEGSAEDAARDYLNQDNDFMNWDKMKNNDRKLEAICTQKWLNFFGYNMLEAWNEMRRTDYPLLKASNQAAESKWICHCPYPQTERNLNMVNVAKQQEIDPFSTLVFWDKKNDIIERTELYL